MNNFLKGMSINRIFFMLINVYICDTLVTYSISWNILSFSNTTLPLALCLCLSASIPFLMQKILRENKFHFNRSPRVSLIFLSALGILISFSFLLLDFRHLYANYLLIVITKIIFFLVIQLIESIIAIDVLKQHVSAEFAAKNSSACINIAGLGAALISGVGMSIGGIKATIIISILLLIFLLFTSYSLEIKNEVIEISVINEQKNKVPTMNITLFYILAIFILLSFSTVGINLYLVELLQKELNWSVLDYGILDAIAGIGGIVGAYILTIPKMNVLNKLAFIILPISFLGVSLSKSFFLVGISLFFWGISMTTYVLKGKNMAYLLASSEDEATNISGNIVFVKTISNAVIPILMSAIFIDCSPSISLLYIALFIFVVLILMNRRLR
jgi:hypothetical protein